MKKQLFTDEEIKELILIACENGANDEQIYAFIKMCEEMKTNSIILESIISKSINVIGWKANEPIFGKTKARKK